MGQVRVRQHVGYFGIQHSAFYILLVKGAGNISGFFLENGSLIVFQVKVALSLTCGTK